MKNIHNVLSWKIHSLNLDQMSRFTQRLTGSTGERGTCSMMPWEYNQQNPDCGKLYRTTSSVSSTNTSEGEREKWEGVGRERELKHEKRFKRYINLQESIALIWNTNLNKIILKVRKIFTMTNIWWYKATITF